MRRWNRDILKSHNHLKSKNIEFIPTPLPSSFLIKAAFLCWLVQKKLADDNHINSITARVPRDFFCAQFQVYW